MEALHWIIETATAKRGGSHKAAKKCPGAVGLQWKLGDVKAHPRPTLEFGGSSGTVKAYPGVLRPITRAVKASQMEP